MKRRYQYIVDGKEYFKNVIPENEERFFELYGKYNPTLVSVEPGKSQGTSQSQNNQKVKVNKDLKIDLSTGEVIKSTVSKSEDISSDVQSVEETVSPDTQLDKNLNYYQDLNKDKNYIFDTLVGQDENDYNRKLKKLYHLGETQAVAQLRATFGDDTNSPYEFREAVVGKNMIKVKHKKTGEEIFLNTGIRATSDLSADEENKKFLDFLNKTASSGDVQNISNHQESLLPRIYEEKKEGGAFHVSKKAKQEIVDKYSKVDLFKEEQISGTVDRDITLGKDPKDFVFLGPPAKGLKYKKHLDQAEAYLIKNGNKNPSKEKIESTARKLIIREKIEDLYSQKVTDFMNSKEIEGNDDWFPIIKQITGTLDTGIEEEIKAGSELALSKSKRDYLSYEAQAKSRFQEIERSKEYSTVLKINNMVNNPDIRFRIREGEEYVQMKDGRKIPKSLYDQYEVDLAVVQKGIKDYESWNEEAFLNITSKLGDNDEFLNDVIRRDFDDITRAFATLGNMSKSIAQKGAYYTYKAGDFLVTWPGYFEDESVSDRYKLYPIKPGESDFIKEKDRKMQLILQQEEEKRNIWQAPVKFENAFKSFENFARFAGQEFATQAPIFATLMVPYVGIPTLGAYAAGEQWAEMEREDILNNTKTPEWKQMLEATGYGLSEIIFDRYLTKPVMQRSWKAWRGAGKSPLKGWDALKAHFKVHGKRQLIVDPVLETVSESLTTITQNLLSGRFITENLAHAAFSGGMFGAMFGHVPFIKGAVSRYFGTDASYKKLVNNFDAMKSIKEQLIDAGMYDTSKKGDKTLIRELLQQMDALKTENSDIVKKQNAKMREMRRGWMNYYLKLSKEQHDIEMRMKEVLDSDIDSGKKTELLTNLEQEFEAIEAQKVYLEDNKVFQSRYNTFKQQSETDSEASARLEQLKKEARLKLIKEGNSDPSDNQIDEETRLLYNLQEIRKDLSEAKKKTKLSKNFKSYATTDLAVAALEKEKESIEKKDWSKKEKENSIKAINDAINNIKNGGHGSKILLADKSTISFQVEENMAKDDMLETRTHELGHEVLDEVFKNNPQAFQIVAEQILNHLQKNNQSLYNRIVSESKADIKDGKWDEVIVRFMESVAENNGSSLKSEKNKGVGAVMAFLFQKTAQKETNSDVDFNLEGETDAINFIVSLAKKIKAGTMTVSDIKSAKKSKVVSDVTEKSKKRDALKKKFEEAIEEAVGSKASSKVNLDINKGDLGDQINSYVKGISSQEEFWGDRKVFNNIYNGIIEGKFDRVLFGRAKGTSVEERTIMRRKLAEERLMNWDPAKSSLSKFLYGGSGVGGNIDFVRLDAKKDLAKEGEKRDVEKRGDVVVDDSGRTLFETTDTGQDLSPEEQMIAQEEALVIQEELKKRAKEVLESKLKLDEKTIKEFEDALETFFGTKLPEVTTKQYKISLRDFISKKLRATFQKNILKTESKYDSFIQNDLPQLIGYIKTDDLVQMERLVGGKRFPNGRKIFATSRRITKVKEVRELQAMIPPLIDPRIKPESGPSLNTRLQDPSPQELMAFFRGKNALQTLGYQPPGSMDSGMLGSRKNRLAELLVGEISFNLAEDIAMKNLDKRLQIEELQGRAAKSNYIAEMNLTLGRNPNAQTKMSRAVNDLALESDVDYYYALRSRFLQAIDEEGDFSRKGIARAYTKVFELDYNGKRYKKILSKDGKTNLKNKIVGEVFKLLKPFDVIRKEDKKSDSDFMSIEEYVLMSDMDSQSDIIMAKFLGLAMPTTSYFKIGDQVESYRGFLRDIYDTILEEYMETMSEGKAREKLLGEAIRFKSFMEDGSSNPNRNMAFYKDGDHKQAFIDGLLSSIYPEIDTYKFDRKTKGANRVAIVTMKDGSVIRINVPTNPVQEVNIDMTTNNISDADIKFREDSAQAHWDHMNKVLRIAKDLINSKDNQFTNVEIAMLAGGFLSNMKTSLRASAALRYLPQNVKDINPELFRYEHGIPAKVIMLILLDHHLFGNKVNLKKLKDSYSVGVVHKKMDDNFNRIFKDKMQFGYKIGDSPLKRWFNIFTIGSYLHPVIDLVDGKVYGEGYAKVSKISKQTAKDRKINKNIKEAVDIRNKNSKKIKIDSKGISVFDFDETVGVSDNFIIATKNGETRRISSSEWPMVGDELTIQGWKFDFSDFNKVTRGKPGPYFTKMKARVEKFGPKNVFILTARAPESQKAIHDWLISNGINIPIENITGLANSTGQAKAEWMLERFAEGYNDMYFVDDALPNVKAVKDVLKQLDIKSEVVQAKTKFSKSASIDFNKIIEESQGTKAGKVISQAEAQKMGKNKGWWRLFVPPSAEDFKGLMYRFLGRGRVGDRHMAWFKEKLFDPFAKGIKEWNKYKQNMSEDFKNLKKNMKDVVKKINNKVPGTVLTIDSAIRVYLWDKAGFEIPGITPELQKKLIEYVNNNLDVKAFADALSIITRTKEGYIEPNQNWSIQTIASDLNSVVNKVGRKQFLSEFLDNVNAIFTPDNMNKIEALYGTGFRDALENSLYRMEHGSNRLVSQDKVVNMFYEWINAAIGAIMFINSRSALLQTLSTVNFINMSDNNVFKAAKAFANQIQYWKDFAMIFNSPQLKQRRKGLQTDVSASELTKTFSEGGVTMLDKVQSIFRYILEKGFTPTQIADSFAIAFGGATFYRNRLNTYLKQGMSEAKAKEQAMLDFQEIAEETQQSSREDLVSQQQAGVLGRFILAFQNVTMQYTRFTKKRLSDLVNRRRTPGYTQIQSDMANIQAILYYGMVQNLIFGALQSGLMFFLFGWRDDDDEEEKKTKRVINGALDSLLRGTGVYGAAISTIKNTVKRWKEEKEKGWNKDFGNVIVEATNLSPPIGSKLRKIYSAMKTEDWNPGVSKEIGWRIENPNIVALALVIEGLTGFPIARMINKTNNVEEAVTGNHALWQRIFMFAGWNRWDVGAKDEELEEAKSKAKAVQKETRKKEKIEKKKKEQEEKKKKGIKTIRCSGTNSSGKRCGLTTETKAKTWKCFHHSAFKDGMDRDNDGLKEYRCKAIKPNGKRCNNKTENKNKRCYAHQ